MHACSYMYSNVWENGFMGVAFGKEVEVKGEGGKAGGGGEAGCLEQ